MKIQKKRPTIDGGAGGAPGFTDKTKEVPNVDDVMKAAEAVERKRKKDEAVKKAVEQIARASRKRSTNWCGC